MPGKRPDPDWGQSMRYLGPAGGKHTRGNKGQKPGCILESIVILAGTVAALGYGVERWFG